MVLPICTADGDLTRNVHRERVVTYSNFVNSSISNNRIVYDYVGVTRFELVLYINPELQSGALPTELYPHFISQYVNEHCSAVPAGIEPACQLLAPE